MFLLIHLILFTVSFLMFCALSKKSMVKITLYGFYLTPIAVIPHVLHAYERLSKDGVEYSSMMIEIGLCIYMWILLQQEAKEIINGTKKDGDKK